MDHSQEIKYKHIQDLFSRKVKELGDPSSVFIKKIQRKGQLPTPDLSVLIHEQMLLYGTKMVSTLMYLQRVQRKNLQWILLDENTLKKFITTKNSFGNIIYLCPHEGDSKRRMNEPYPRKGEDISIETYMDDYSKHALNILKLGQGNLIIAGDFVTRYHLTTYRQDSLKYKQLRKEGVDFYLVGIKPENKYVEYQTSSEAEKILDSIFKYFRNGNDKYVITKSRSAITIVTQKSKIFRFFLKLYPSPDTVIGSMDLDPRRVFLAYKNGKVDMKGTLSFALALKTWTFPIDVNNINLKTIGRILMYKKLCFCPIYPHTKDKWNSFYTLGGTLQLNSGFFQEYNEGTSNNYRELIAERGGSKWKMLKYPQYINVYTEKNWLRLFQGKPLMSILHPNINTKDRMIQDMLKPVDAIKVGYDNIYLYLHYTVKNYLLNRGKYINEFPRQILSQIPRDTLDISYLEPLKVFLRDKAIEKLKDMEEPEDKDILFHTPKDILKPFNLIEKSEKEFYGNAYYPLCVKPDRQTEIGWLLFLGKINKEIPKVLRRKIMNIVEMEYVKRMTDLFIYFF